MLLEEKLEPIFHTGSYGYRPGRSAHDALAVTRKRCREQDWVLDLDVRAFFDSVPHDLLLKAVAHHTDERCDGGPQRLGPLGLELHPDKTRIVLCKDADRPGEAEHTNFDYLGHADPSATPSGDVRPVVQRGSS
jgi:hypothetical protein